MTETIKLPNLCPPPPRVTAVESIIEQIVGLIRDGSLKPGDRLPSERKLMELLQVSRSTVREATQALTAMGLVEGRVGAGTFVTKTQPGLGLSIDIPTVSSTLQREMRQYVNQARLVLEKEIILLAIDTLEEQDANSLLQALGEYELHGHYLSAHKRWPVHDQLHLCIAEATHNPVLVLMLRNLMDLIPMALRNRELLVHGAEELKSLGDTAQNIHRQLCEAVIRKDQGSAQHWLGLHAKHEEYLINRVYDE